MASNLTGDWTLNSNITLSTSVFAGGTSYIQAQDVLRYLKIAENATQDDYDFLANFIIPLACDYIDRIAGTTWGLKYRQEEYRSIGKPMAAGFYLIGAPIYTQYFPIYSAYLANKSTSSILGNTLQSLQIWNGISYQEWVGFVWENRNGNYWVDKENGIIYIIGWWWYMGYEARISYYYGFNVTGTINMPGDIKEFALLKAAKLFLDSERYTALVTEGIGGIEMTAQWNYLNKRLKELETYYTGFRTVESGFLP